MSAIQQIFHAEIYKPGYIVYTYTTNLVVANHFASNGSRWMVAAGLSFSDYLTSDDLGQNWTGHSLPFSGCDALNCNGTQYMAILDDTAAVSTDAINWTTYTIGRSEPYTIVPILLCNGSTWVAPSNGGGKVSTSTDNGQTWSTQVVYASYINWTAGLHDGTTFYILGSGQHPSTFVESTVLMSSTDGATWSVVNSDVDPGYQSNVQQIRKLGSYMITCGNWPLMYSTDSGVTWQRHLTIDRAFASGNLNSRFIYLENNFIADSTYLKYSTDGNNWTLINAMHEPIPFPSVKNSSYSFDSYGVYMLGANRLYVLRYI